jgi:hypothetical protein
VRLPAETIGEAETVQDLVRALEQSGSAREHIALDPPPFSSLPSWLRAKLGPLSRFLSAMQRSIQTVCT